MDVQAPRLMSMARRLGAWLGAVALAALLGLAACGGPQPGIAPARDATPTAPQQVAVVSVHDGDTVRVRDGSGQQRTVRLATIDAPELEQPYGVQARDALRARLAGRVVTLVPRGRDRYGRTLAVLWVVDASDAQDVALGLVQQGLAWHYRAHAHEQPWVERWRYAVAEIQARQRGIGLWAQPDPQPPWAWRRQRRAPAAPTPAIDAYSTLGIQPVVAAGRSRAPTSQHRGRFRTARCRTIGVRRTVPWLPTPPPPGSKRASAPICTRSSSVPPSCRDAR
ncbi:MAG: thermonuclease family protein [Pseudomonadota bacterium]|uniref:thermonuclease family protein n=1 Tax=Tepidimonas thermarum TaxID=335431 RepID=UPI00117E56C1|nr:thermonuclease family protein [Tepidimonas thermarum]